MLRTNKSPAATSPGLRKSVLFRFVGILLLATASCGASETVPSCAREGVTLESGIRVVDLTCGKGRPVESGHSVQIDYVGLLDGGEEFDSSERRGPYTFRLGAGQVIDGLDEGLINMRVGGRRRLTIPSDYAYDEIGLPPLVPPNATVVYEVELLKASEPQI